jgi:protease I
MGNRVEVLYKMADELKGKTVVVLAADGFEQVELLEPRKALEQAGATVHVASLKRGPVKGWHATEWGEIVEADRSVDEIAPAQYDALLLPGGVMNPDKLRMSDAAVGFVRSFFNAHKPVAAICHGPWLLAEAAVIKGYTMTSYPSIKTDLKNAGATWVDEQVVVDRGLVTSRKPDDIPAFNRKMIEEFAEGPHTKAARREREMTAGRR